MPMYNDFVFKCEVERQPKSGPKRLYGVKPLWRLGSYDGPVTGICEYEGELHFFEMLGAPGSFIGKRAYAVYKLTPSERIREWVGHWVFVALAGDYENLNEYGIAPGRRWKIVKNRQWYWSLALDIHRAIRRWPRPNRRRYHYITQPALGYFTFRERDDENEET